MRIKQDHRKADQSECEVAGSKGSSYLTTVPRIIPINPERVSSGAGTGDNTATGRPRFVIVTASPSRFISLMMRRHLALNSAAGTCLVVIRSSLRGVWLQKNVQDKYTQRGRRPTARDEAGFDPGATAIARAAETPEGHEERDRTERHRGRASVAHEDSLQRQVESIEVPAEGEVLLKPHGLHVMLFGLKQPLVDGESFDLTVVFEKAGELDLTVDIERTE